MEKVKSFLAVILFCSVWTFVGIKTFGMSENSMKSGQLFISETEGTLKTEFFGKLWEEQEQTKQKALYAFSIEELERMLSDNCRREQEGGRYMESVGSIYLFKPRLIKCFIPASRQTNIKYIFYCSIFGINMYKIRHPLWNWLPAQQIFKQLQSIDQRSFSRAVLSIQPQNTCPVTLSAVGKIQISLPDILKILYQYPA